MHPIETIPPRILACRFYGSVSALAFLAAMQGTSAQAQEACGPSVSGVVTCATADPAEYSDGILYSTTAGLTLHVSGDIIVTRVGPGGSDAVQIHSSGSDPLIVTVDAGASLRTVMSQSDAIQVSADGASDI
jgi:hypothetical protein